MNALVDELACGRMMSVVGAYSGLIMWLIQTSNSSDESSGIKCLSRVELLFNTQHQRKGIAAISPRIDGRHVRRPMRDDQ